MRQLETLSKKALPPEVRGRMCLVFSRASSLSDGVRVWLLDQAELLPDSREIITDALVGMGTNQTLQELVLRTHLYKPGKVGEKAQLYEADYRKWVLITVGKMKVGDIATRETRGKLIERLESVAKNDKSPEVRAEAAATLTKLQR